MSKVLKSKASLKLSPIYIALSGVFIVVNSEAKTTASLEQINVKASVEGQRKSNEVTGLGKVVKNTQDINKQQVLNIRDLTRYDPGISVTEQGRGATSGYSIRGVDRNRVALLVDGLPQIQSYKSQSVQANSGAINEIEYENIRTIELSKGASSAEYGNGALGGAVGFLTKNAKDVLKEGQTWGINSKTAYATKNSQITQSLNFAGKVGGFEGLVQYTHRQGKETQIHPDAYNVMQRYYRVVPAPLDFNRNQTDNWFILKEACQGGIKGACEPRPRSYKAQHVIESINPKDYTGEGRIVPNPMEYKSGSWFVKTGYQFTPEHSVNLVFENTQQHYDIQDMTYPKYATVEWSKGKINVNRVLGYQMSGRSGVYRDDPLQSLGMPSIYWTRSLYLDEHHKKRRIGTGYQYANQDRKGVFDRINLNVDQQNIQVITKAHNLQCSPYPTFDKHCTVGPHTPDSEARFERNTYKEVHKQVHLSFEKDLEIAKSLHLLGLSLNYGNVRSSHKRDDYQEHYTFYRDRAELPANFGYIADSENRPYTDWDGRKAGTYADPQVFQARYPTKRGIRNYCDQSGLAKDVTDCSAHTIKGTHYGIALRDNIFFGEKVDLGIGLRYDQHSYRSDDTWTSVGKFSNFSWNTGLAVRPLESIELSYRISSGFRNPSFDEMFGRRIRGAQDSKYWQQDHLKSKFKSEKSLNQEIGLAFAGNLGALEVSYFRNQYKDLIAEAKQKVFDGKHGFYNLQDIQLSGVNVLAKLNWSELWNKLPSGLYSNFAYNQISPKQTRVQSGYAFIENPFLDTIQPARYVASLGYDAPDEKWGVNGIFTYSQAKNAKEVLATRTYLDGSELEIAATNKRTTQWYIYDLIGYYQLGKHFTLRAGVYNLTNSKYSTWEAVRQSSRTAINPTTRSYNSYVAPGRNYVFTLEAKF
ncbi:hemoglobin/transferrin/lactoferrin receptor protein [Nicoletella semolina]|uniref:Hemoglobin/transferrin/lactoferrin receptor protein n=1 Tax=Nicoletella semolina TaxID=271160 RepID=A0A4R2N7V6_9PAST|nr:lactoferrin/transferrin family TonB-dependent receptor [Nicoletella semolina]MDH2924655.1 hypothetical protein [Nicoletella semolina]TCP17021.1 hemoglobin/transferrin/lactoferrin receptor protein [Nicoletella semolina]